MNLKNLEASLSEELPYWEFFESPEPHLVLSDGSIVAGIRVSLKDIECLNSSEVNHMVLGLRSVMNSLTEGCSVQFSFKVTSDYGDFLNAHKKNRDQGCHAIVKELADHRDKSLNAGMEKQALYRPQLTVFVRVPAVKQKRLSFFRKTESFTESASESFGETFETLLANLRSLRSGFENIGSEVVDLSCDDLISYIYQFLNPKREKDQPPPNIFTPSDIELDKNTLDNVEWLAADSPRSQLVFGDLLLDLDHFVLDSYYHRVLSLKTLPEVTVAGQLSEFLRLPFHYELNFAIHVPDQSVEMARLQRSRKMSHALYTNTGNRASDLEIETKLTSIEELLCELLNTGQKVFMAQMTILLREPVGPDGLKNLNRQTREVLSRFRTLQGAEGLEESVGAWKILRGDLPGAPMRLERAKKMKTNNLVDFLPIFGPREGDPDPQVIFRNRLGGLIGYNSFSSELPNFNVLTTGTSGSGKSFLSNSILLQELSRKMKVFIIDIGGSYKKLTNALDGQYIEINLSKEYRINPFHIPDPSQKPSSQKIKSLLAVIECMVADDGKMKIPKMARVTLEKVIVDLYADMAVKAQVPTLSHLKKALECHEDPSMRDIGRMLYMWTGDSPYGQLLDGEGVLDTDSMICTFDLKGLSAHPDLQSVMILILTDYILAQVDGDKSYRKRIILDEAWELLKSDAAASFMEYCARTLRKTGSGITFITQGVGEIVASPIGSAILETTATKFVMLQGGSTDVLAKELKLNSQEVRLIDSLGQRKGRFSEALMITGEHRQVIQIHPTPIEYWLSTSDPDDNRFLDGLQKNGLNLKDSIFEAAKVYPKGVAYGA